MATIDPVYLTMLLVREEIEKSLDDKGNPIKLKKQYINDLSNKIEQIFRINMEQCVEHKKRWNS